MERGDAEAIYGQGRDAVVAVLLRMDEQIEKLTAKVVAQDERIVMRTGRRQVMRAGRRDQSDRPGGA